MQLLEAGVWLKALLFAPLIHVNIPEHRQGH